jgi:hypothetical protein
MAEECEISKDNVLLVLGVGGVVWYIFLGKLS